MVNDFREYAGVIDENDYIRHFLYLRKEKRPWGWNYVYPDDQVGQLGVNRINKKTGGKIGKALHSKLAKKLYNDTVAYKRMKADQNMRNSHKKLGNGTYIDYEDHFPFESNGRRQIGATSYVKTKNGNSHYIRTQSNVGDDAITLKDLRDTFSRQQKAKINSFIRKLKYVLKGNNKTKKEDIDNAKKHLDNFNKIKKSYKDAAANAEKQKQRMADHKKAMENMVRPWKLFDFPEIKINKKPKKA